MKWLEENLYLVYEWLLTFSNRKSFFSSKRIERFSLFTVGLLAAGFFLFKGIYNWEITSTDVVMVVGMLFGYAGFTMVQTAKDKPKEPDSNNVEKE